MANSIVVSGSVVSDPVLKFLDSGSAVTNFAVRVVTGQKRDNEQYAPSMFLDVVCWNAKNGARLAENVAESVKKGNRVVVTGQLKQDEWVDKDTGAKRTKVKVNAFEVAVDLSYATVSVEENERTGRAPAAAKQEPEW